MSWILSWSVMAVTMVAVVAWEAAPLVTVAADPAPTRHASADPVHGPTGSLPEVPDATWIATALERPLFQETRRPAKVAGNATEVDRAARLTGVMTGPFGSRAIFTAPGNARPIVVGEGARVSDFVVRSIGPGVAVVETETGMRTLRIAFAAAGSPVHQ